MFIVPAVKEALNRKNHKISLWRMLDMDLTRSIATRVFRNGEWRTVLIGTIDGRAFTAVTTERDTSDVRAISLRPASRKERQALAAIK
ncbi:MAG: hypothetical protein ABS36_11015 [Acidobacteria bacterium SCN 69-37]|nr:MAG: hypothetical protein ABS36_11015 [Acidobacteria bacterium SCN 69-37]